MRTAWPDRAGPRRPSAMPWGRVPDRHQPTRDHRQDLTGGRRSAQPPTWTARRLSDRPSPAHRRSDQARSASNQVRRSPCRRPLGPRSARHRLVTGPRRPAQGPPAPHPATPAQFPAAHYPRGPIAARPLRGQGKSATHIVFKPTNLGCDCPKTRISDIVERSVDRLFLSVL